jgi:hypothetical protein
LCAYFTSLHFLYAWAERHRQKLSHREGRVNACCSGNADPSVFIGEFAHTLTAGTARREQGISMISILVMHLWSAVTMAAIAAVSAQMRKGKVAFSTFVPGKNSTRSATKSRSDSKPRIGNRRSSGLWPLPKKAPRSNPCGNLAARTAHGRNTSFDFSQFGEAGTELLFLCQLEAYGTLVLING